MPASLPVTRRLPKPALSAENSKRLALIERQIADTEALILEAVPALPDAEDKLVRPKTVKGVKQVTAVTLLALLPEPGSLDRRAIAALVGLAPFDRDSGTLKGTRSIAGGSAAVRTVLYKAARRAAALSKSPLGDFYRRLVDSGKSKKIATVAFTRKMIVTLNAILRDRQPWRHANPWKTQ
ncbi:IS110 family transposase [Azospirillum sp. RWY-5-1]|uniref:IS110 family transposase n=1 Tax=Azospirillum oleiclasticum TaxID=2735135 RepID=A0ABX2TEA3_9PROT|nr:transposase [Azospirillum oleiclasticum]NYZ17775.1 IS110 family transposase [Azospirillum oleiclasticum]NYZ21468.1 IS110 family transposase [Azospirillum oleiclasticum]